MKPRFFGAIAFAGLALGVGETARASFHLMQIEQVIGGVNGDTSAQAIQLRLRSLGQNLVSAARMRVADAAGLNPITIIDFTTNVPTGTLGSRILITSPNFTNYTNLPVVSDFTMTNLIPDSYMAAGTLTFESNAGLVYWRLSWGGASYTGSGSGAFDNDNDANFNPPFGAACPTETDQAILFDGLAADKSTNNADDYILTAGAAVFTNNAGGSFTVVLPPPPDGDGDGVPDELDNCPDDANADQADCDGDNVGDVCALSSGSSEDCNVNDVPDNCDIADGRSDDTNGNGVPDECEEVPCDGDANGDGEVDPLDYGFVLARLGCTVGAGDPACDDADSNSDGEVDPLDAGFVQARFGPCD